MPLVENVVRLTLEFADGQVKDFREGEFTVRKVSGAEINKRERADYYQVIAPFVVQVVKGRE